MPYDHDHDHDHDYDYDHDHDHDHDHDQHRQPPRYTREGTPMRRIATTLRNEPPEPATPKDVMVADDSPWGFHAIDGLPDLEAALPYSQGQRGHLKCLPTSHGRRRADSPTASWPNWRGSTSAPGTSGQDWMADSRPVGSGRSGRIRSKFATP
jgi:hypothetical protein